MLQSVLLWSLPFFSLNQANAQVAPPASVSIASPASGIGSTDKPVIRVGGVAPSESVRIFTDSTCSSSSRVGMLSATAGTVDIPVKSPLPEGQNTIYARRVTSTGKFSKCSSAFAVYLRDSIPPTISGFNGFTNGQILNATTPITASASDANGSGVKSVDFLIDGNLTFTDTTAPFSFTLNPTNFPPGSHAISARAHDQANNSSLEFSSSATFGGGVAWSLPSGPIPSTSAFHGLLSSVDQTTKESYRVLYHWVSQYSAADFDLPKTPITYNSSYLSNDENAFKVWSLFANRGRYLAHPKIIQVSSDKFLASTIDVGGKFIVQNDSRYVFVEPISAAWHYSWDYPGNPNFQRPELMHRAFAYAIPMMAVTDNAHHRGLSMRTDFLGGTLIRYAVPYFYGKHLLPGVVQQAYEQILVKLFDRARTWNLNGTFGDMEIQAAVGMYYVAEALNNPVYRGQAATRAQFIFERMISGAGFEKHENGADVVYQGIAQHFTSWLLTASQSNPQTAALYAWLHDYMTRSCKFLNHLTYLEPTPAGTRRRVTGPSHFNAANGGSIQTLIWNSGLKSFLGGSYYTNECRTLLHNQFSASYEQFPLSTSPNQMRTDLQSYMSATNYVNMIGTNCSGNDYWSVTCSNPSAPAFEASATGQELWTTDTSFPYIFHHYVPGFYNSIQSDIVTNAQWNSFPHQRSSSFIEELEDVNEPDPLKKPWFISAKSNSLHTTFFLGGLAWRNSATNIAGFGGGAISSVATVAPIIMGSERGNQDQAFSINDWRVWPTHHFAGEDSSGKYFGNARDRNVTRTVSRNGNISIAATINGSIDAVSNPLTNPSGNITGLSYQRVLSFNQSNGINVTTSISNPGNKQARELWDIIPVYLFSDTYNNCAINPEECTKIEFKVNGVWIIPGSALTSNVSSIRLSRYNTPLYIHFTGPKSVKLSPTEITLFREPRHHRNIMIDLHGNPGTVNALPNQIGVSYNITTSP